MKKIFLISSFLILNQTIFAESIQNHSSQLSAQQTLESAQWRKAPRIRIQPCDLENQSRQLSLLITADANGKVIDVKVLKSTTLEHLDKKIIKEVFDSRFRATSETFTANQDFNLQYIGKPATNCAPRNQHKACVYLFESDVLKQQMLKQKTTFQYREVPNFYMTKEQLKDESRDIYFSFKLSRHNEISNINIDKSSGLNELDAQVVSAFKSTKVSSDTKWWQFFKVTHHDHIHFDIDQCPQTTPK